ncbi:MAG TPA: class I SAM-dependent methyltransferase, partial [Actinoplanes sp.]|nr:class I SAM-dependent methyltransferase [Actinoplanes sp.]
MTGFSPTWLALREGADADARSVALIDALAGPAQHRVIHDLGCGTGSMSRWLAPRLPGPQHWVLHDHDPALLEHAAATMPATAADGAEITVETRQHDITRLTAVDLAGAHLVTCSALLDLLTDGEVDQLA